QATTGGEMLEVAFEGLDGIDVIFFYEGLAGRLERLCVDEVEVNQVILLCRAFDEVARIAYHQLHRVTVQNGAVVVREAAGKLYDGRVDFDGGDGCGVRRQGEGHITPAARAQ